MNKNDFISNKDSRHNALSAALASYMQHGINNPKIKNKDTILIVNFDEPSYRKRLYLYDLNKDLFIKEHHVAHGANSSNPRNRAEAISFSNVNNSHKSSLGAMYTGEVYYGKHGKSCKLHGLERGINDNVFDRVIVIHPSNYVTDKYILNTGKAGESFGCLAIDPIISAKLIDLVKDGTFVYAYGGE